ncbi:MAG: CDP-alcohol phosphatidyltransferase family protein [Chloroflexi bacterium]|jgi:CDP-diacylglycerol--glycerol-3-phosphate 3-phosphatidyltransferase|nr:CDP-alcohol phosphatidyltransferase family protein [Chloroflexota bacterium]
MFTDWLRKVFKNIVGPIARFLGRMGLSANGLTILGCLLTVAVSVVIATGRFRLGGLLLIATTAFDALDGTLAREQGGSTRFGAFLDSVLDRVTDSAILLGVAWWYMGQAGRIEEMLAYAAIVGSMLVSYTRARAEAMNIECKVGLFTRVERTLVIIVALIVGLVEPALWVLAVGTWLTTIHRMVHVYQQTKRQPALSGK